MFLNDSVIIFLRNICIIKNRICQINLFCKTSNQNGGKSMAKIDYTQLAREIVAAVGGKENINRVGN